MDPKASADFMKTFTELEPALYISSHYKLVTCFPILASSWYFNPHKVPWVYLKGIMKLAFNLSFTLFKALQVGPGRGVNLETKSSLGATCCIA